MVQGLSLEREPSVGQEDGHQEVSSREELRARQDGDQMACGAVLHALGALPGAHLQPGACWVLDRTCHRRQRHLPVQKQQQVLRGLVQALAGAFQKTDRTCHRRQRRWLVRRQRQVRLEQV